MEHQSAEDAEKWAATLDDPLPWENRNLDELDPNEIDQLANL